MQDRFKFRSYGRPNSIIEGMQNIYTFEESKDGYFNVKVDKGWLSFVKEEDLKIMQSTGLKDKNGKLIYEGDILKDKYGCLHPISWNIKGFYEADTFALAGFYKTIQEDMEVVGNIYENGDLLNEQIS